MNDSQFERDLLASARGDAPPHDVQAAWTRFAGALSLVAPAPVMDGALARPPVSSGGAGAHAVATAARGGALRASAMKWLLLGAIGGSSVTAVVLTGTRSRTRESAAPRVEQKAADLASLEHTGNTPAPPPAAIEPALPPDPHTAPTTKRPGRRTTRPLGVANGAPEVQAAQPALDPPMPDPSILAAEVARLDAARSASADGDHDEALRLIERYHQDFPDGALAPDADVVAIEAVAATHDHAEVARRAAQFLSRYPDDPHAARVRWLAARNNP